jgi:ribosome maturation factor RimP
MSRREAPPVSPDPSLDEGTSLDEGGEGVSVDTPAALEAVVLPICRALGLELVDVRIAREPGGAVLRVLIDRERLPGVPLHEGGVSLDDCTDVSRDLSTALDVSEEGSRGPLSGRYRLEVSSPGVDRPLVKLADFARFAGETVKLTTRMPVATPMGERRKFQGTLLGVSGAQIRMTQDGHEVLVPHAGIVKANLVFDWTRVKART